MDNQVVKINSLSPTGHGIAENGWYILGAFPGDIIKATKYHTAEGITYGEIAEIITPSPYRTSTPSSSPFFNPNAPWEYLEEKYENKVKQEIVNTLFNSLANIDINTSLVDINVPTTHYRNKTAYSFMLENSKISFALYTRGISGQEKISQQENILVHPMVNHSGKQLLEFFRQKKVPLKQLKYLIIRYSYLTNTVVAHILVTETNRKNLPWKKSDIEKFIHQHPSIRGILVSHSEPNIRSSTTTKYFYEVGDITIIEKIVDHQYHYHPSQFFQIYPEAFSFIVKDIEKIISEIPNHNDYELLDLFAGIGLIGLHLAYTVNKVHGVEYSPLAREYALSNAKHNNIENFSFSEANVDEVLEYIKPHQILIVDPARSGLTKKLIKNIIEVQPEYIIYISCNPETQAEDVNELKNHYDIVWSRAYNLFPKTSHIEHVVFLKRKTN